MRELRGLIAGAAALLLVGAAAAGLGNSLRAKAAEYYSQIPRIANVVGVDAAIEYYQRLLDDADSLDRPPPPNYPAEMWSSSLRASSDLDRTLVTQLERQSYRPMGSIRGSGETLVRSSRDGTLQPVAVYVPSGYVARTPAALAVFLHGHLQTESQLLGAPYIAELAEQTNTIVIAPYARGRYDYRGSESDVYDAFDAASSAFTIDPRKRFLIGYSMGGFSAFRLAPMHPDHWSAIMCIAGSLLASRAAPVMSSLRDKRFYVLTGSRDGNVPTSYGTVTAIFLRDAGLAVTFYSQPEGTHSLYSLRPILSKAWNEMVRGIVRLPMGLTGGADLPDAVQ